MTTRKQNEKDKHFDDKLKDTWVFWTDVAPLISSTSPSGSLPDNKIPEETEIVQKPKVLVGLESFSTYKEFWGIYNGLDQPSSLNGRGSYSISRDGVIPIDTDKAHCNGVQYYIVSQCKCDFDEKSVDFEAQFIHILFGIISNQNFDFKNVTSITFTSNPNSASIIIWTYCDSDDNYTILKEKLTTIVDKRYQINEKRIINTSF